MSRALNPEKTLFLMALGATIAVWVLRGLGALTFLPGLVIWFLMFLTIGLGILTLFQVRRRY